MAGAIAQGEPRDPLTGEFGAWVTINDNGNVVVEIGESRDPEIDPRSQKIDAIADGLAVETRDAQQVAGRVAPTSTDAVTLNPPLLAQPGDGATSVGFDTVSVPDVVSAEPPALQPPSFTPPPFTPPAPPPAAPPAGPPVRKRSASRRARVHAADQIEEQFWNPCSGRFNGPQLRLAIVMRGWTVGQFHTICELSLACVYRALDGYGVSDETVNKIFDGLERRQPRASIPELRNAR